MLHPDLLRSFIAVAEAQSFSLAGRRLGLGQSTVSQHVKRLEESVGRPLFLRDTHSVVLTPDGDALLGPARQAVAAHERVLGFFADAEPRGRLRLGVSEDVAASGLRPVLQAFVARHPAVDIELTVGLSALLYQRFDAGELDTIFAKRRQGDRRGLIAWREPLVWLGRPGLVLDPAAPLPLLLYPPPSITRSLALKALEEARRAWRVACTSGSLAGLHAAAHAGLGIVPHSARLRPAGLEIQPGSRFLPPLGETEFVLIGPTARDRMTESLMAAIEAHVPPGG